MAVLSDSTRPPVSLEASHRHEPPQQPSRSLQAPLRTLSSQRPRPRSASPYADRAPGALRHVNARSWDLLSRDHALQRPVRTFRFITALLRLMIPHSLTGLREQGLSHNQISPAVSHLRLQDWREHSLCHNTLSSPRALRRFRS